MSDDLLHQAPTGPAPEPAEVTQQPSVPAESGEAEGTGASEQGKAETEQQAAERIVQERKVREARARRNQEAAFRRLREERDELQRVVMDAARRNSAPPQEQGPTRPSDGAPKREQFASWEEYEDARIDWRASMIARHEAQRREQAWAFQQQMAQRAEHERQVAQVHSERNAEFAKAVPDFEDVTARDDIVIPDDAADAIRGVPNGPAILYAIGKDPTIAQKMHSMNPTQQAAFVGQLSAALMLRPADVSQAPAPGKPVGGSSAPVSDPAKMSYDDFVKFRRKQIAARR